MTQKQNFRFRYAERRSEQEAQNIHLGGHLFGRPVHHRGTGDFHPSAQKRESPFRGDFRQFLRQGGYLGHPRHDTRF